MNPFEDEAGIAQLEPRLGQLVGHFRTLAEGMRDLPLYNHAVVVEAVDFLPFGGMGFGVLVTPWFMSALFLPLEPVSYDAAAIGTTSSVPLPVGDTPFQLGGDEVVGLYWAHSLLSPLAGIASHEAAVERARADLDRLLTLPEPARPDPPRTASRRTIFTGPAARPPSS